MLSQKLLVDVGVGSLAGKNRNRQRKSAAKSSLTASFRPLAVMSGSGRHLGASHLKNEAPTGAGDRADFRVGSVPCKAFSVDLAASDITL